VPPNSKSSVHAHPSDFFVPQNGQKELINPFYAGSTEGNFRLSGSVKGPLPEGFPFPRTSHFLLPAQQHLLGPQAQNKFI
jgi:hypothetical protein